MWRAAGGADGRVRALAVGRETGKTATVDAGKVQPDIERASAPKRNLSSLLAYAETTDHTSSRTTGFAPRTRDATKAGLTTKAVRDSLLAVAVGQRCVVRSG